MYNVSKIEQLNILNRWKENDPTTSLKVPIGVHADRDLFILDLHEKAHGPHGLIAGSTGSGKSEFIITFVLSRMSAEILISVFATKGTNLFYISLDGFMLFSLAFLVAGINIFVSGMFTAYSNGKVSALISFLRTFIFFGVGMLF